MKKINLKPLCKCSSAEYGYHLDDCSHYDNKGNLKEQEPFKIWVVSESLRSKFDKNQTKAGDVIQFADKNVMKSWIHDIIMQKDYREKQKEKDASLNIVNLFFDKSMIDSGDFFNVHFVMTMGRKINVSVILIDS